MQSVQAGEAAFDGLADWPDDSGWLTHDLDTFDGNGVEDSSSNHVNGSKGQMQASGVVAEKSDKDTTSETSAGVVARTDDHERRETNSTSGDKVGSPVISRDYQQQNQQNKIAAGAMYPVVEPYPPVMKGNGKAAAHVPQHAAANGTEGARNGAQGQKRSVSPSSGESIPTPATSAGQAPGEPSANAAGTKRGRSMMENQNGRGGGDSPEIVGFSDPNTSASSLNPLSGIAAASTSAAGAAAASGDASTSADSQTQQQTRPAKRPRSGTNASTTSGKARKLKEAVAVSVAGGSSAGDGSATSSPKIAGQARTQKTAAGQIAQQPQPPPPDDTNAWGEEATK